MSQQTTARPVGGATEDGGRKAPERRLGVFPIVIMIIGANKYAEGLGPIAVGILILGMGLCFGGPTGYALNPARDLGPRFMHAILPFAGKGDSDWSYSWIPVAAPICGAVCAALTASALLP